MVFLGKFWRDKGTNLQNVDIVSLVSYYGLKSNKNDKFCFSCQWLLEIL